ncbi:hypothetical protein GYA19_05825 [Candidatus Beckwithbacteria bacterium]|nr:hypothetical protein [Candidatus Beckwithbacteria bacterium]
MKYNNDVLFLSVAGFCIKIEFNKTPRLFEKKIIKNQIKKTFKFFIKQQKNTTRSFFTLNFVDRMAPRIITKVKKKENFIEFYRLKGRHIITFYDISIIQFQYIMQYVIQLILINNQGLFIHSSAINYCGKAYLFLGQSGTGKSTIIKMLKNKFEILSDDSSIIKKSGNKFFYYQTPFIEKESWVPKKNIKYPIGKIFLLRKSKKIKLKKVNNKNYVIEQFSKHIFFDWTPIDWVKGKQNKANFKHLLHFLLNFDQVYQLSFPKNKTDVVNLFNSLEIS